MRGIIVAVSPDGVIGKDGGIPWHYSADLKRFKRLTLGTTIIMGRRTWESLPKKPLPRRRNIVITRTAIPGAECFTDLTAALAICEGDVWFIGGARLYAEAMSFADVIDVTRVPDIVDPTDAVLFPSIDPLLFESEPETPCAEDPRLRHQRYVRRRYA